MLWRHKICILCSQDKDLMDHTSQEWLNGVHLFNFQTKSLFLENISKLLIFHKSNGKVRSWGGTTITATIMVRWTEGGKSHEFQHCKCRHSGIGEKEAQTQSVVGKNPGEKCKYGCLKICIFSTTLCVWVSFSPIPECLHLQWWNS